MGMGGAAWVRLVLGTVCEPIGWACAVVEEQGWWLAGLWVSMVRTGWLLAEAPSLQQQTRDLTGRQCAQCLAESNCHGPMR